MEKKKKKKREASFCEGGVGMESLHQRKKKREKKKGKKKGRKKGKKKKKKKGKKKKKKKKEEKKKEKRKKTNEASKLQEKKEISFLALLLSLSLPFPKGDVKLSLILLSCHSPPLLYLFLRRESDVFEQAGSWKFF